MIFTLLLACGGSTPSAEVPKPVEPAAKPSTTAATPKAPAAKAPAAKLASLSCSATTSSVTVQLGLTTEALSALYPTLGSVPAPYDKPTQPSGTTYLASTLDGSIEGFTKSSLELDGFTDISVTANSAAGTVAITATGCNLAGYQTQLPAFLAAGQTGYAAWVECLDSGPCAGMDVVHACTNNSGSSDKQCVPWEFYLPLGQPLVNHRGVMLLNYPPDDALCSADYQNNFTMNRWRQVLDWGVEDPYLFANIVDLHPIAAAGSGESQGIASTTDAFSAYWQQMLKVVANPPGLSERTGYGSATLPVMVSGSPSHDVWETFIGSTSPVEPVPKDNSLGVTNNLVTGKTTAWVATNHPDVASYNCCEGDKSETCCDGTYDAENQTCTGGYGWSWDLYDDEVSDFTGACYFENTSLNPTAPFADFALTCARGILWGAHPLCVQGRMDYTFTETAAHCNCRKSAEAFCATNGEAMCPSATSMTSCETENAASCPTQVNSYVTCASL